MKLSAAVAVALVVLLATAVQGKISLEYHVILLRLKWVTIQLWTDILMLGEIHLMDRQSSKRAVIGYEI